MVKFYKTVAADNEFKTLMKIKDLGLKGIAEIYGYGIVSQGDAETINIEPGSHFIIF